MATDDRKRRILDHLSRSSSGADYVPKKPASSIEPVPVIPEPVISTPPPSPTLKAQDRKRRVMDHLSMSSQKFGELVSTADEEKRKRQIQEHIRESGQ
jgi:hypothetical protein